MHALQRDYLLKIGGTYVPDVGREWDMSIRKGKHWMPLNSFEINDLQDIKALLRHPYAYTFYTRRDSMCMCVIFSVHGKLIGITCSIYHSDYINKAYYYANGTYLGCIPYKHKMYKMAYLFDRLFFYIYRQLSVCG